MKKALLVGYGELGERISKLLIPSYKVLALKNSPLPDKDNIKIQATDISNLELLKKSVANHQIFFEDLDLVVFCVAPSFSELKDRETLYKETYHKGIQNILKIIKQCKTFLLISSTSVYSANDQHTIDESTSPLSDSYRGQTMLAMEGELKESPKPATKIILRASGLYGKTSSLPQSRGPANKIVNRIHIDDCARLSKFLIDSSPKNETQTYIGVDNEPASYNDILSHIQNIPNKTPNTGKSYTNTKIKTLGFTFTYPTFRDFYKK